ncbi:MAG: MFS transporter [Rhizobiales bacterium]|nr:MFS transporter [Hyphomicrobiales bacterium]
MTDATIETIDRYAAFRHKPYMVFWLSRFFARFAAMIISVAVGWQIYDLTRDPFDLGLIGLVQFLPALLLVLITGAVADRYGRKNIMTLSILLEVFCAVAILYFSMMGLTSPIPIFIALGVFGVARAFFGPAASALVANLVPEKDFANAVAWNSSSWQTASIVGPAVGGLLYGISANIAYGVALALFVSAFILAVFIKSKPLKNKREVVTFKSLFGGFSYIYKEKVVFGAISLDLFAVLFGGAVALLPIFARDILELGPWGLGFLRAAPGIGAVLMALFLTGRSIKDNAGLIMLLSVGLFGLSTAMFAVSTIAWVSILLLAVLGAADMVSVYIRGTLVQLWTPDALRGRVSAVSMVFVGASNELGEFRAGTMAAFIGTVPAVLVGGVGAMVIAFGWAFLFPQLLKAKTLEKGK